MNRGVAIGAAAIKVLNGTERLRLGRVPAAVMAGVANTRHARLQQLRVAGAVRLMAVRAILHDRRMLPEEWAAAFCVAAVAILVGGGLDQLLRIRSSMRIVAARAGHFAFAIWHVGRALQLCPAHLVALQAQLRLCFLHTLVVGKRRVVAALRRQRDANFLLHLMAIHARHAAGFVRTALPEHVASPGMARLAGRVLLGHGVFRILAETHRDGVFSAPGFYVRSSRPMTGLTSMGFVCIMRMGKGLTHHGVLKSPLLVLVASDAGLRAYVIRVLSDRRGLLVGCRFGTLGIRLVREGAYGQDEEADQTRH